MLLNPWSGVWKCTLRKRVENRDAAKVPWWVDQQTYWPKTKEYNINIKPRFVLPFLFEGQLQFKDGGIVHYSFVGLERNTELSNLPLSSLFFLLLRPSPPPFSLHLLHSPFFLSLHVSHLTFFLLRPFLLLPIPFLSAPPFSLLSSPTFLSLCVCVYLVSGSEESRVVLKSLLHQFTETVKQHQQLLHVLLRVLHTQE